MATYRRYPLTAVLVAAPRSHAGNLILNADGSFSYTPSTDYNGSDRFTYKTNDGGADSSIAIVSLTVNPNKRALHRDADSFPGPAFFVGKTFRAGRVTNYQMATKDLFAVRCLQSLLLMLTAILMISYIYQGAQHLGESLRQRPSLVRSLQIKKRRSCTLLGNASPKLASRKLFK